MAEVLVYTRAACSWCGAVKKQLDKHGYEYREVRADLDEDAMKFLMDQMAFTFPQVFVGDTRIGGYEATVESIGSGEFARLHDASSSKAEAARNGGG
jgi:glutaredoxin 3